MLRNNKRKVKQEERFGLSVKVFDNNIDQAIRVLRKKVQRSGLIKDLRERQFYTKPSEERQLAKKRAIKRWLKKKAKAEKR